jgi:hypothetical protein
LKYNTRYFFYTGLVCCYLTSCFGLKEWPVNKPETAIVNGSSFIELKDGSIINGSRIVYPAAPSIDFSKFDPFKKQTVDENWIGIDSRKIPKDSIYGYQDQGKFTALHLSIALSRLAKGKINLYSFERIPEGSSFNTTYYVFEKEREQFKKIDGSLEQFYELISDKDAAAKLCKELFPYLQMSSMPSAGDKLKKIVDLYNN